MDNTDVLKNEIAEMQKEHDTNANEIEELYEVIEGLEEEKKELQEEIEQLENTDESTMWLRDLDHFEKQYTQYFSKKPKK